MAKNPAINMMANSINTSPKRRSMKLRMDDPKKYNNAATAKKRRDLAAIALAKKTPKPQNPAVKTKFK